MDLHQLQQSVPKIRAWIENTLASHRPSARPVTSYGFPRLGLFYPVNLLASAHAIEVPQIPMPPLSQMGLPEFAEFEGNEYNGITYLDTYFLRTTRAHDESLHFHELVHVVQWQHLGPERFLMAYAVGYFSGGEYRKNPLETMAYELQDRFDQQCQPFDVPAEIRRRLDIVVPTLLANI